MTVLHNITISFVSNALLIFCSCHRAEAFCERCVRSTGHGDPVLACIFICPHITTGRQGLLPPKLACICSCRPSTALLHVFAPLACPPVLNNHRKLPPHSLAFAPPP